MDLSEGGVTVGYLVDQDAHRQEVVDLIESDALVPHLVPDAVDVFGPPGDLGWDAGRRQLAPKIGDDPCDVAFALGVRVLEGVGYLVETRGLHVAQGGVFELPLELPHTEPARERCEHRERVLAEPAADRGVEGGGGTQAHELMGQADQQAARVVDDGQQHVA